VKIQRDPPAASAKIMLNKKFRSGEKRAQGFPGWRV
jgi:hypothetical protein